MTSESTPLAPVQTADIVSPVVMGNDPQPVVSSPVVEPATPPVAEPAAPEPAKSPIGVDDPAKSSHTTPEWAQKRINELTAARYAAERKADEERKEKLAIQKLNTELMAARGTTPDPAAKPPVTTTDDEIERRAMEKAQLIAQASEFNKACNTVAETGKKEFADWDSALSNLNLVGALGKDVPPTFLETAVELKNPHKVLHHLGTNMDEAARIAKLPPAKMAMEMARLEATLNAPPAPVPAPPVSNAPAPVIPVGGAAKASSGDLSDPNLSMEEYNAIRNKQIEERRKRYQRV